MAGDRIVVLGSLRSFRYRLPGIGTICVDPAVARPVIDNILPTGRAITARERTVDLPPGIKGTLHWQAVAARPDGTIRWITNCERTDF